jgi:hypothetical protein
MHTPGKLRKFSMQNFFMQSGHAQNQVSTCQTIGRYAAGAVLRQINARGKQRLLNSRWQG